jgi:hypothetical protein
MKSFVVSIGASGALPGSKRAAHPEGGKEEKSCKMATSVCRQCRRAWRQAGGGVGPGNMTAGRPTAGRERQANGGSVRRVAEGDDGVESVASELQRRPGVALVAAPAQLAIGEPVSLGEVLQGDPPPVERNDGGTREGSDRPPVSEDSPLLARRRPLSARRCHL